MSSSIAIEAPLPSATTLDTAIQIAEPQAFNTSTPGWWAIVIEAHGDIVDSRIIPPAPAPPLPTLGQLLEMPPRPCVKLAIRYGASVGRATLSNYGVTRIIDAVPGQYYVWSNAIGVSLLTSNPYFTFEPVTNTPPGAFRSNAEDTIVAYVEVGVSQLRDVDCYGDGPSLSGFTRAAQYTHWVTIEPNQQPSVVIPAGASALQIWDTENWQWQQPAWGTIPLTAGQSDRVLIPTAARLRPATTTLGRRQAVVVFEVDI